MEWMNEWMNKFICVRILTYLSHLLVERSVHLHWFPTAEQHWQPVYIRLCTFTVTKSMCFTLAHIAFAGSHHTVAPLVSTVLGPTNSLVLVRLQRRYQRRATCSIQVQHWTLGVRKSNIFPHPARGPMSNFREILYEDAKFWGYMCYDGGMWKFPKFAYPRWQTTTILKIVISPRFIEMASDVDEILYAKVD